MNKIAITEEMHKEKEWFADAKKQTIETLPEFVNHVMNDYQHDYGTVCRAVSACALAAAWAANNSESGGITGFQAGFVMWDFVRQWTFDDNKCGLRIVDFDNMFYPQYEEKFQKTISKDTWEALRKQAEIYLKEESENAADGVVEHWKSIVSGTVPFGYTVED